MRQAVTESSFRKIKLRVEGVWLAGREVYGYFLTDEEFERIRPHVVQSGYLGGLGWETPHAFLADCGVRERSPPSAEYIRRLEQGASLWGVSPIWRSSWINMA